MTKFSKRFLFIPLTLMLAFTLILSFASCEKKEEVPMTADVKISLIDNNDTPIENTEIVVQGISNTDTAAIYVTDSNGQFTVKNLGEKNISVIIHTDEESYRTNYTITKSDLERGEITIKFNDYIK